MFCCECMLSELIGVVAQLVPVFKNWQIVGTLLKSKAKCTYNFYFLTQIVIQ